MNELIDLIDNNNLKCQKCEAELTPSSLLASIMLFGVVLLFGEEDGWVGWQCPGCAGQRSNFNKISKQELNQLINTMRGTLQTGSFGNLCYHSFPYQYALVNGNFHRRFSMEIDDDFPTMKEEDTLPSHPSFEPTGKYRSYEFDSLTMKPAISVWWYDDSQIERLVTLENESGRKAFPRYLIYNRLYSCIDEFCWNNRIQYEFISEDPNSPYDIKEVFLSDSKKRINKNYDFVSLLDTAHSGDLGQLKSNNAQRFISPETVSSILIDPALTSQNKISATQHHNFSGKIWSAFHSDWMQELLDNLSEDFISDYLALIGKINCTLQSIWDLKESYLKILFEAVSSRYRREKVIEKSKICQRRRVEKAEKSFPGVKIISQAHKIAELKEYIAQVAPCRFANSFLILGDPGTGKELFAKAIHEASGLDKKKFRKVSCGERSADLFASEIFGHVKGAFTGADRTVVGALAEANGGAVFFDEIGNLPLSIQPKLLRVLQDRKYVQLGTTVEKEFIGKFIFATNKNLDKMVEQNLFMPDLYDRFNVFKISIPPLSSRKEDIPMLVDHFLQKYGGSDGLDFGNLKVTTDCMKFLESLKWKGNIRVLENAVKEIVAKRIGKQDRSEITIDDIPAFIIDQESATLSKPKKKLLGNMKFTEKELLESLKACGNNKTHAAEMLGVDPCSVHRRLKKINAIRNQPSNLNSKTSTDLTDDF